jgi:hypothetical protein
MENLGGEVVLRAKRIFNDLRSSWYFRLWLLFWVILAIVWFVGMGFLANRADDASKHKVQQYFVDHHSKIEYPKFQLRFPLKADQSVNEYNNPACTYGFYNNITVPSNLIKCLKPIGGGDDTFDYCLQVDTTGIFAVRGEGFTDPVANNRLTCIVNITGGLIPINQEDVLVAFELLNDPAFGPNSGASLWIAANNAAWVLLTKATFNGKDAWERDLLYHSSRYVPGFWQVTAVIDSFRVERFEDAVIYDGWQAAADIGGFITFLMIFHVAVMIIVGLFCVNNSQFLKDEDEATSYGHSTI